MKSHKLSFNVSDWKALLRRANCMGEGHLTQCDLNKLVSKENRTEVDAMPFIQNVIGANIQSSLQKSYSPVKNSSFAGGILKNAFGNQIPANLS
jgi:hypothetical protein